jgi:hypothetical protein
MTRWTMVLVLVPLVSACAAAVDGPGAGDDPPPAADEAPPVQAEHPGAKASPPPHGGSPYFGSDDAPPPEDMERPVPDVERVNPFAGPAVTGEVPVEALAPVLDDASQRTGVAVSDLEILRSQYVEWPDGSLGCPQPGMSYTQAIQPGYWVEVRAGDRVLDYRLTVGGFFKLCESSLPGGIPGKAPDSEPRTDEGDDGYGAGTPDS